MVAPVLAREGARPGGLGTTTFAVVCRTDSNGVNLKVNVYSDPQRKTLVVASSTAALNAANNYQATAYITGLTANTRYWWEVEADDGAGNSTKGVTPLHAGEFKTFATRANNFRCHIRSCLPWTTMELEGEFTKSLQYSRQTMAARKPDFAFQIGDIYYPDIGTATTDTTPYGEGVFFRPATDADATIDTYRTNFMNTYSAMSHPGSLPSRTKTYPNSIGELAALIPHFYMWDDHDRAFDGCDDRDNATGDRLARWAAGRDSGHEMFMGLQKAIIDVDTDSSGSTRSWTAKSSEDSYFVVDIKPVRFIVLDGRSFRDSDLISDTSAKSLLGTKQKAWLKARIADNPMTFTIIMCPIMFDGNHGWNETGTDGYRGYQTERAEIFEYIWQNGDPQRTVIITGDTHESAVVKYRGPNLDKHPIYSFLAGNSGWIADNHGFINGFREDNGLTGSTDSPYFTAGNGGDYGGELVYMGLGHLNYVEIEVAGGKLDVRMMSSYSHSSSDSKVGPLYTRSYR